MAIKYEADETIKSTADEYRTHAVECVLKGHQSRDPKATREFRTAAAICASWLRWPSVTVG